MHAVRWSTIGGAIAILVVGTGLGLLLNSLMGTPLPLFYEQTKVLPPPDVPQVTLEEAKAAFDEGTALFLDARPAGAYAEGHIPGALSFPLTHFRQLYPQLKPQLDQATRLIAYCDSPICHESVELVQKLQSKGYSNVAAFVDGWSEWEVANYPVESSRK